VNHTRSYTLNILQVDSSGRAEASVSRRLAEAVVAALSSRYVNVRLARRNVAHGLPFVDADWIAANMAAPEERNVAHRRKLAESDRLVDELRSADVLVIGVPIYNFGVPAALKAWVDMVARAGETFRYTENGPVGLLRGKKAYLAVASGGVAVGSAADFATPYLRHALKFIGIEDAEVVAADQLVSRGEESVATALSQIAELVGPIVGPATTAA